MTPPAQTGDPVRLDRDNGGFYGDPRRMAQELNFDSATGEYTPFGYNDGPLAGGPLASGIFGATPTPPDMSLLSPTTGVNGGTILNPVAVDPVRDGTVSLDNGFEQETTISPGQPIPGMIPRVGAFEPPPISNGGGMFSFPNVERGANVPDWMLDNPDFDPRSPSQSGMQEYTNPATGETYMGSTSSNNQYMLDPSLTGEFTPPNRSFSLESGEVSFPDLDSLCGELLAQLTGVSYLILVWLLLPKGSAVLVTCPRTTCSGC